MQVLNRPCPAAVRASPIGNASCTNKNLTQRRPSFRPTSTAVNEAITATITSSSSGDVKLVGPEPQRFVVAEGQLKEIASAAFITMLRAGAGALTSGYKTSIVRETDENKNKYTLASLPGGFRIEESSTAGKFPRPAETLIIYDAQNADSRKIREALCILDIDTMFKPCAEGGNTSKSAPSSNVPFMIDPNNGTEMSDADEIVAYLFRNYGNNKIPLVLRKGPINDITAKIGMAPRKEKGTAYTGNPEKAPTKPLEYWAYEASPFCAVVREVLSELEIPHLMKTVARGSTKRQELFDRRGHFQAPYLEDPNTGVAMFESAAIIEYLRKTYGNGSA